MKLNNLLADDYITSNNFAKRSQVVFSEVMSKMEFYDLPPNNYKIIYERENEICYLNPEFRLNENDIIFSNTEFISFLFRSLNKINNLKNIKLITHWSDRTIEKKMFFNRPKIISEWFSVHINHIDEKLISVPLGLSGNYSKKNLIPKYFQTFNKQENIKKENLLYINFQKNTNSLIRNEINEIFEKYEWVKIDKPNLDLDSYLIELSKAKFVLCPFGNGFDTHRLWETIYAGSIPIIIDHPSYNSTKDLPVVKVKSFSEINKKFLIDKYEELKNEVFNYKKLDVNYWVDKVNNKTLNSTNYSNIKFSNLEILYIKKYFLLMQNINRAKKIVRFRINQIKKISKN